MYISRSPLGLDAGPNAGDAARLRGLIIVFVIVIMIIISSNTDTNSKSSSNHNTANRYHFY